MHHTHCASGPAPTGAAEPVCGVRACVGRAGCNVNGCTITSACNNLHRGKKIHIYMMYLASCVQIVLI
jgi:hypothetical protein